MKNPQKPGALENVQNILDRVADLHARRENAQAEYANQMQQIELEKRSIEAIQAPLHSMLPQRADLLERIKTATEQRAKQVILNDQWQAKMDAALGVRDAAHLVNLAQLMEVFSNDANASRMISELDGFISRRKAELGNLEAKITDHAAKHSLGFMLPEDLGGKAPSE
jgi:hypothetical protein